MNPTTDSQALLTKTFLNFTVFFLFCFLPCRLSLPNSNSTPLFPIPYYYVQLMSNTPTTGQQSIWLYLSFYFFYLYNARQQEPQTQSQSQKPKTKKKKKHTVQFSGFSRSTTQAPNQLSVKTKNTNKKHSNTTSTVSLILRISDHRFTRFWNLKEKIRVKE